MAQFKETSAGFGWRAVFGKQAERVVNIVQTDPTVLDELNYGELIILAERADQTPPTPRKMLAEQFGVSVESILQWEKRAMRKLLRGLAIHFLDHPDKPPWISEIDALRASTRTTYNLFRKGITRVDQLDSETLYFWHFTQKQLKEIHQGLGFISGFRAQRG
ncbi:hypothetical protein HYS97_01445 [Candidatus Daviesbacteria bacterium]|nr:hypothetical protein [Candidatus Daviesbacteria bacterium]